MAIVGYDDSPVASIARPQLTSVRQPIEEMGHEMARLLVDDIAHSGRVPRRIVLGPELLERESSAGRPSP